jgi:uncharacterized membrane protein YqjE
MVLVVLVVLILWRSFTLLVMNVLVSLNLESRYLGIWQRRNVCRNVLFSTHILRDCT